jgi:hypothetical protein
MGWLTSRSSHSNAGCLQRGDCKLCVCEMCLLEARPGSALYSLWAGLHCVREGVCIPLGSATLHVFLPGPVSGRTMPPVEIESCSSFPRHRPSRPWPRPPPSLSRDGVVILVFRPLMCWGRAYPRAGRLPPPLPHREVGRLGSGACWAHGGAR